MTWILLRGLTREARHWGAFAEELGMHLGPQRIMAVDLPGNGELFAHPSPSSVRGMVHAVRQQLLTKGLTVPYQVMALSLGGMVAADWAQQFPQEVSRVVLINTSMRPFSRVAERLRPRQWARLALMAAHWNETDRAERTVHSLTSNRVSTLEADMAQWVALRQMAPVSALNAARQLWAAARFSCSIHPPLCPVLVLSSRADQLVDPSCSTRLAQAWKASWAQHPWAGHDLPHDDATWVCQKVADWMQTR